MAEIEMQDYEQLGKKEENPYDAIKVDKRKPSRIQFFKKVFLIITISLCSAGILSTVTYFLVCAQLQQKFDLIKIELENIDRRLAEIDMKLEDFEKEIKTELKETVNQENTHLDGKDTSFLVIFHEGDRSFSPRPMIFVASANTANLSLRYFNNTTNQTITIDKRKTEQTLSSSVLPSDGIHLAGVEVQSDVKINLYGFEYTRGHSEGFLSMPLRFASTKYVISTLPPFIRGVKNRLALSPIYQNTAVCIHLKMKSGAITYESKKYSNNDTLRLVINKYNTLQLSHASDLSGTMVTSSKPVIVVSGNQCNYAVPDDIHMGGCLPFIESVLPTDQLDHMFITPYISTRLNNTVRIQAVNSTNLTIKTGKKAISKTLNARDFLDFYYNEISFISSSDDILVMSYPHGLIGTEGDPFMMTIQGVNQYLYEYDFVVPTGFDSFISITVQSDFVSGYLIDDKSPNIRSVFNILEGMHNFSTFSLPISAGYHRIEHEKKVRFGLWVYGNRIPWNGYGYPAGLAYKTSK